MDMSIHETVGLSSAFQLVDGTASVTPEAVWDYSGTQETWVFTLPEGVKEWRVPEYPPDLSSQLFEIRKRSFARLGEAWRILADQ
jgi:hypothetical protein